MINKYKNFLGACLVTITTFSLHACSDSNSDEPEIKNNNIEINARPAELSVGNEAATEKIIVKANADWSMISDAEWCKIFPSGGLKDTETTITVNISANSKSESRTCDICIISGNTKKTIPVLQTAAPSISINQETLCFGAQQSESRITLKSNISWTASNTASWLTLSASTGETGETAVTVTCQANATENDREATIEFKGDGASAKLKVIQYSDHINVPEGYILVWSDEFNTADGSAPDMSKWYYDEWAPGFVNNELQRYVAGSLNGEKTAEIIDGVLNITARKSGSEVISARLNTRDLWTYGYFEARLKLPKGKGTWPAFWMMPANGNDWPHCGEIDIMEEVGCNPNYTSSSIHCTTYNHTIGTQKTAERLTPGAEDEFHVYALEWTPDFIRTYVDGKQLFHFANDGKGDQNSWPFDKPFHPILNLAWGGSWGGMNGVDETALPATYMIDYVRVFQKQ